MTETAHRIDIGFQGGQILPCRVSEEGYKGLRTALADSGADRWYELSTQDSEVALDLSQIVYVRLDTEGQKVGF